MLVRSGAVDVIIVDSVAALTPKQKLKAKWAIPVGFTSTSDVTGVA